MCAMMTVLIRHIQKDYLPKKTNLQQSSHYWIFLRLCTHTTRTTLHNSSSNWQEQKSLIWSDIQFAPSLTTTSYLSLTVAISLVLIEYQQLQD